jgi:hypothetical protein
MDPILPSSFRQYRQIKVIAITLIVGIILFGCSNPSLSVNKPLSGNQENPTQEVYQSVPEFDPGSVDPNGNIDVAPLIDALKAGGFSEEQIMEGLNALIDAIQQEGYSEWEIKQALDTQLLEFDRLGSMESGSLVWLELMSLLKSSHEDQSSQRSIRPTFRGLPDNDPNAPPVSYDPEMELTSPFLICPSIPQSYPVIPQGPYDVEIGDCALKGKSAQIETWLTELEQIAIGCQANREINWAAVLETRLYLDAKIDELLDLESETPQDDESAFVATGGTSVNTGVSLVLGLLQAVRGTGGSGSESTIPSEGLFGPSPQHYTEMLQTLSENVEIYCRLVDGLIEPIRLGCVEINLYQEIQSPDPALYHAIIDLRMNEAQVYYDSADSFFLNNLQTYGWDGFRSSFNEASLDCPLDLQAPSPTFTFSTNTFGRFGPSSEYRKEFTFLKLQSVQIIGRNNSEPFWWLVVIPGTREHVWVSDSTGTAVGILEDLEIVPDPPLFNNRDCSQDMSESICIAAGGTWADKDTPSPYCDCP